MDKISVGVVVCNQLRWLETLVTSLSISTSNYAGLEIVVVDNGSTEDVVGYCATHGIKCIRNARNLGIFRPYNQIIEATSGDWIAFFHNDIMIHEGGWNERIRTLVNNHEKAGRRIGIVGFAGSRGGGPLGERIDFASNLRGVAEIHGRRMKDWMVGVFLDGAAMICRREMLAKVGGFDQAYKFHHLYDYDISMASISAGYFNLVVGIDFTHQGGITACQGDAQKSFAEAVETDDDLYRFFNAAKETHPDLTPEQAIMDYNISVFRRKWVGRKGYLPILMKSDFEGG